MPNTAAQERRHRILAAARDAFVERGFHGASMDEIAGRARVSKPTIYKHYGNKEGLFAAIVNEAAHEILTPLDELSGSAQAGSVETLADLARTYARVLLSRDMLEFHRLAISEAARFPDLGQVYYDNGPRAVEEGIREYLKALAHAGVLTVDDPELAAQHFWALVLGPPRQVLLFGARKLTQAQIDAYVKAGIDVFLDHYGTRAVG